MMERRTFRFLAFAALCFLLLAVSGYGVSGQEAPVADPAAPANVAGTGNDTDSVSAEAPPNITDTSDVTGTDLDPAANTTSEDDAGVETFTVGNGITDGTSDNETTSMTEDPTTAGDETAAEGTSTTGDTLLDDTEVGTDDGLADGDVATTSPGDLTFTPDSGNDTADTFGDGTSPELANVTTADDPSPESAGETADPLDDVALGDDAGTTVPADDAAVGNDTEAAAPTDEAATDDGAGTTVPADDAAVGNDTEAAAPTDEAATDDDAGTTVPADEAGLDEEAGAADPAEDATTDDYPETADPTDEAPLGNDTDTTSDTETDIWDDEGATEPATNGTDTGMPPFDDDTDEDMTSPGEEAVTSPEDEDTTGMVEETDGASQNGTEDETDTAEEIVPETPSTNDTSQDEQPLHERTEKADFVVYDKNHEPCLLASLNITLHFKYQVQEGLIRETYDTVSKKSVEDDSSYEGMCEENMSKLSIRWNNDTFTLNLTFVIQDGDQNRVTSEDELDMDVLPPGVNFSTSWALHQVALSYDTGNEAIFPGASNPSVQSVKTESLNLFKTPLGLSYMCQTPEAVGIQFKDVDLVFNFIHLLPFEVDSKYFTNETVECSGDLGSMPGEGDYNVVPVAVAACLAAAVVVIIIAYAGHRCATRRARQAEYKQMP